MQKFLTIALITMFLSVSYVFQHAKLLEYGCDINSAKKDLSLLIDHNRALRYNVSKLEAPGRLDQIVIARSDQQTYVPLECYNISVKQPELYYERITSTPFENTGRFLLSMFSLDTEAVANE